MFEIGEYVLNQNTGNIGKVIGYGHQLLGEGYMTTLKVLIDYAFTSGKRGVIEEDVYSSWAKWLEATPTTFKQMNGING